MASSVEVGAIPITPQIVERSGRDAVVRVKLIAPGLLLAAVTLTIGCGSYRVSHVATPDGIAWPADDPRVRLEEVIPLDEAKRSRAAKLVRRLADAPEPTMFRRPYAAAWDGDDLVIADPGTGRVARITSGGRVERTAAGAFDQPIGVAVCGAGIVVSDSATGRLELLDPELQPVRRLAEDLVRPTGVACAGDTIYVAETGSHRVVFIDGDGSRRTVGRRGSGSGEFNFPTSLAIDGATLLVADTLNFRIQRVDRSTGEILDTFGVLGDAPGEMPRTKGVAVDRDGHLWIADAHLDLVSVYNGQGRLLTSIGGPGNGFGEFSFPAGIAARPDGRIAIVDSLNRRLQVLNLVGSANRVER